MIVTVCSALQFEELKVSVPAEGSVTVPSPVSELVTPIVTSDVGCEASLTVKVAVAVDSSVSLETAET